MIGVGCEGVRLRYLVLRLFNPDFNAESEFAISSDFRTRMTLINVEIRVKKLGKSFIFIYYLEFFARASSYRKKYQRSSTEETLDCRTV